MYLDIKDFPSKISKILFKFKLTNFAGKLKLECCPKLTTSNI